MDCSATRRQDPDALPTHAGVATENRDPFLIVKKLAAINETVNTSTLKNESFKNRPRKQGRTLTKRKPHK